MYVCVHLCGKVAGGGGEGGGGVKGWLRNQVYPLRATLAWMHSVSLFGVEGVTVKS